MMLKATSQEVAFCLGFCDVALFPYLFLDARVLIFRAPCALVPLCQILHNFSAHSYD
jgi:hypothetical protein